MDENSKIFDKKTCDKYVLEDFPIPQTWPKFQKIEQKKLYQKHQFAKKELVAMNRSDIVEKWLQTNLEIYEEYKNYPYMVELKNQKYVKTVNRYSKFLEITDTGLKI